MEYLTACDYEGRLVTIVYTLVIIHHMVFLSLYGQSAFKVYIQTRHSLFSWNESECTYYNVDGASWIKP